MTIRKYLFQSFLALCCTLVGCLSAHDVPVPETERETTLTLRLSPEAMTRSGDGTVQESAVHDLSLYFFHKTTPEASERLYLKNPGSRVSLSLPTGDYELFALANTGGDPGELTAERLAAYTLPLCNDEELVRQGIAMSARQSVRVEGATEIPLRLERCLARLDLSVSLGEECPPGLELHSITLRSIPATLTPFADNRPATETLLSGFDQQEITDNSVPARTYYLPENLRGTNPTVTEPRLRDMAHAPEGATFVHIHASFMGVPLNYYIFLGSNTTDDFNLRRNRHYRMEVTVRGVSNDDCRVSMTTLLLSEGFAPEYDCSQTAALKLLPFCTNDPDAALYLSYELVEGTGRAILDGSDFPQGTRRRVVSDTPLEVGYTQSEPGDVRMRFTLSDAYGNPVTVDASTVFRAANPLTVAYGTSKVGMVATVTFRIGEPGYTGRFTIAYRNVSGSGSVSIDGAKIVSGGSKTTDYNTATGLSVPVDITPSGDYRGRFTISDSGGHSRTYEVSIASGVRDMTVTEITQ